MSSRGVYGPGTFTDDKFTPVPLECKRILKLLVKATPGFTQDVAVLDSVSFVGGDYPIIPGPIKSQAVTAVIHAMAGIVGQEILELRGQKRSALTINTDQAGLYLASPVTFSVDGRDAVQLIESGQLDKLAPDTMNGAVEGPLKYRAMAIYPTKNPGEWYQWHGSNDPNPGLRLLGIDPDARLPSNDAAYELIKSRVSQYSAKELDMMMTEHGLCGCTCYTPEAWRQTSMAKVLARHPLINYKRKLETPDLPPSPFHGRAGPHYRGACSGAGFGRVGCGGHPRPEEELGGSDFAAVYLDCWKENIRLGLGQRGWQGDAARAAEGCRRGDSGIPDSLLGAERIRARRPPGHGQRARTGIVYLDENCFGPDGCWAERPGWQQIADAAAGSTYVMGRAYGYTNGECVLPSLPISDMSTGAVSLVAVLMALRDRAKFGGSYYGAAALTAYNTFTLQEEVGLYQPDVVAKIQEMWSFPKMTPEHHVYDLLFMLWKAWVKKGGLVDSEDFYAHFRDTAFGRNMKILAPIIQYANDEVNPRWITPPQPYCYNTGAIAFANASG
ncbi:coA-transferase family III domain-containing protein [Penicillium cosmopolitanum]|uniref:CoA-transferase family III domain-containing protein n=1 Tax=Penicillium cosmopolitanum TaxID=1131564 RepID=A0A9W9W0F2_9EURO|nr:coA-transferase family III domain-containing protein [Penicillium cosmopolitanum]KAJ5392665.1 coA-transferase family III domain-containing protein [Penicillium cosmopolitanum]